MITYYWKRCELITDEDSVTKKKREREKIVIKICILF